jgi:hypothetical protein
MSAAGLRIGQNRERWARADAGAVGGSAGRLVELAPQLYI